MNYSCTPSLAIVQLTRWEVQGLYYLLLFMILDYRFTIERYSSLSSSSASKLSGLRVLILGFKDVDLNERKVRRLILLMEPEFDWRVWKESSELLEFLLFYFFSMFRLFLLLLASSSRLMDAFCRTLSCCLLGDSLCMFREDANLVLVSLSYGPYVEYCY